MQHSGGSYLYGRRHWYHSHDHHRYHGGDRHPSSHGLYHLGFEIDRGRVYHSRARGGHLCEVSSLLCHDEVVKRSDALGSDHVGWVLRVRSDHRPYYLPRGQNRIARTPTEESEPTEQSSVSLQVGSASDLFLPRSSGYRRDQDACYAFHGRRHPRRDDSHTRRKQICVYREIVVRIL